MTKARRRPLLGAALPYNRLAAIALILAATMPATLLGILVYDQVERSLSADAVERTERAVATAKTEVDRAWRELDDLVRSYARWNAFAAQVDSGDLEAVRTGVLEFLVEQGTVDGGLVWSEDGAARAGPASLTAALEAGVGRPAATPRFLSVDGEVYLVDEDPVTGTGTAEVGRLILARKLDARFVTDIAGYTGFAVAVLGADGATAVTTDTALADAVVSASAGRGDFVRAGDLAGRLIPLGDGSTGEKLVLATQVSALQSAAGALPFLVVVLVLLTGLIATLLAMLLSTILNRRLGVVHDGLIAVADGRVPPSAGAGTTGDIARLAAGLDRLVVTLDRRENTLRACLAAAAAIPIHVSRPEAASRLAASTVEIFGVAWCELIAADGAVLGRAGAAPSRISGGAAVEPGADAGSLDDGAPPVAEAMMGLSTDQRRMEVGTAGGTGWTDGDQASLEVMALLAGSVLDEVEAFGQAAGRADRLDRLNRLQREFLRSISHNLRTPLATIELAASDLEETTDDPFVRTRAEAIRIEEQRLARLVNQVLILSRMETGTLSLDGEPVALAALVRRVARELGIPGRVEVVDRAPGIVAFTDPAATEQIAWILLDNAARYAASGPIRAEITAAGSPAEPAILLAIKDQGPGVPPEDRRRIFRRFVRGTASGGGEGTGLGLSVARGLARTLGGDVTYRPGAVGARFEVRLPAGGGFDEVDGPDGSEAADGSVRPGAATVADPQAAAQGLATTGRGGAAET